MVHAFTAGLPAAEESAHDIHGDTEYQYELRWLDQDSNYWNYYPKEANENDRATPGNWEGDFVIKRLFVTVKKVTYKCKHCYKNLERHFTTFFNGPLAVFMDMYSIHETESKKDRYAGKQLSVWGKQSSFLRNKNKDMWTEYLIPQILVMKMIHANDEEGEPVDRYRNTNINRESLTRALEDWMPWLEIAEPITEHEGIEPILRIRRKPQKLEKCGSDRSGDRPEDSESIRRALPR